MKQTTHTPAPWITGEADDPWEVYPAINAGRLASIATINPQCPGDWSEEDEANARLIAAAPKILEALRSLATVADRALGTINSRDIETGMAIDLCRAIGQANLVVAEAIDHNAERRIKATT